VQWDEPFGLVMIEAMAAAPRVGHAWGICWEVIKEGVSGNVRKPPLNWLSVLQSVFLRPSFVVTWKSFFLWSG